MAITERAIGHEQFTDAHQTEANGQNFSRPDRAIRDFYTKFFKQGNKSDSTPFSRTRLLRRFHTVATELHADDTVLDLASGPQILARQFISSHGRPAFQFQTCDDADIDSHALLAKNSSAVHHTRASGEALPYADNSMSAVISNMGIEYMQEGAIDELHRVTKEGGSVFLNIWTTEGSWIDDNPKNQSGYRVKRSPSAEK